MGPELVELLNLLQTQDVADMANVASSVPVDAARHCKAEDADRLLSYNMCALRNAFDQECQSFGLFLDCHNSPGEVANRSGYGSMSAFAERYHEQSNEKYGPEHTFVMTWFANTDLHGGVAGMLRTLTAQLCCPPRYSEEYNAGAFESALQWLKGQHPEGDDPFSRLLGLFKHSMSYFAQHLRGRAIAGFLTECPVLTFIVDGIEHFETDTLRDQLARVLQVLRECHGTLRPDERRGGLVLRYFLIHSLHRTVPMGQLINYNIGEHGWTVEYLDQIARDRERSAARVRRDAELEAQYEEDERFMFANGRSPDREDSEDDEGRDEGEEGET